MAGGLLVLGYSIVKKRTSQSIFLFVWSVVMLLLTIRFQRFQYYLTVNVVILAALCIVEPISWRKDTIIQHAAAFTSRLSKSSITPINSGGDKSGNNPPPRKKDKKKEIKRPVKNSSNFSDTLKNLTVLIIIILAIGLIVFSLAQDLQYGINTPQHEISPDWIESLEWLERNTPQTGIDYFKSYESRDFSYPPGSYGIMAVWDAGHWITFFSDRIPITNPFQDNLRGILELLHIS